MLIFIRALSGTVVRLNVSPCETILTVKTRIYQSKGIPVNQQHLIYDGVELSNATILAVARISHGALLRLVISIQSGPLTRDSAHASCTTQFCHKPVTHKTVCPLAVPVTPFHRLQAPTVVLPVLCAQTRIPEPPAEHHHHHLHHHHDHRVYAESQPHAAGHVPPDYQPSDSSEQHSIYPIDWVDSQCYLSSEYSMDEDALGLTDDGMSEIAEYLGYAIDENELAFQQREPEHQHPVASCMSTQSVADDRAPLPEATTRINPILMQSTPYRFVPIYPIPTQMQWIVDAVDPTNLTSDAQASDSVHTNEASPTVSTQLTRFSPVPLAFGIPLPFAPTKSFAPTASTSADTQADTCSVSSDRSERDSRGSNTTTRNAAVPSVAFALPAHLSTTVVAQLHNFVSDMNGWSGASSSLVPGPLPNWLLPSSFAIIPVASQLNTGADATRMDKESDQNAVLCSADMSATHRSASIPLAQPSTQIEHSIPTHIPETKEQFQSSTDATAAAATVVTSTASPSLSVTSCAVSTSQTRCFTCQKRTRLARGFSCRCQLWFCHRHHHPEDHNCQFNFKTMSLQGTTTAGCCSPAATVSESRSTE